VTLEFRRALTKFSGSPIEKVPSPSKKSIRGNMAPGDRTMNVWSPLILVIPLLPLSIRPIIKLLRLYRQDENVFERLPLVIA